MKHIIIGTAGHIDHGKTTLIKALTGDDTDRLAEEKRRGITIELGFTYFMLPSKERAGIVDVPGHEKFINNMVAGVAGMDMVLLVIAADEGIMPQTREHMDILRMLGVKKCIIVLNKVDLVEPDWMEMVEEEIREELSGTCFESAPLAKVSSVTGQGMKELVDLIDRMAREEIEQKNPYTIPRLPIDRVFTVGGFGTIVTGTLVSGTISKEEILTVYPQEKECRVRNIQVHGENVDKCYAGQRVAINISNIKKEEIKKGNVLAPIDSMKNTKFLDVKLKVLESIHRTLKNNTRLHLYTGTEEVLCRAVLLDAEELKPGECGYAQLRLEKEIAVCRKDKFIIRFYSPVETIGGGVILESNPPKRKRFKEEVILELSQKEKGTLAEILELHVKASGKTAITASELSKLTSSSEEEVLKGIEQLEKQGIVYVFSLKKELCVLHAVHFENAKEKVCEKLMAYAETYPYRYGMRKSEIHTLCFPRVRSNVFDKMIEKMIEQDIIKRQNEFVALAGYEIKKDKRFHSVKKEYMDTFSNVKYDFVRITEIDIHDVSDSDIEDIRNILENEGLIIKVSEDIYTIKAYMDEAVEMIRDHFKENEVLTIVQTKEMFDTSRKNAKLMIEFMDQKKVTRKSGAETERRIY